MAEIDMGGAAPDASDAGIEPIAVDGIPTEAEGGASDLLSGILKDIRAEEAGEKKAPAKAKAPAKKPEPAPEIHAEEESDDSEEEEAEEAPKPAPKKKYKAKANGKEYEFDEDKVEAELSRGLAARQKYEAELSDIRSAKQEIEHLRAQVKRQMEEMQSSPEKYFESHEDVAEKVLAKRAEEYLKLQQMPPEAREEYKARVAAESRLKEFEAKAKEQEAGEHKRLVETQKQQLEAFLSEGLAKHGLPKNTLTLRIMAGIVQAAAQKGIQVDSAKAAELTRRQLKEVLSNSYTDTSVESFVSDNPKLAEAVRDYYVKRAQTKPAEIEDVPRNNGQFAKRKATKAKEADPFEEIEKLKSQAERERSRNGW